MMIILRFGVFLVAVFLATALGLMDYILIKGFMLLLGLPSLWQLGVEMTILQGLILASGAAVIVVDGCVAIGVFGWGLGVLFESE